MAAVVAASDLAAVLTVSAFALMYVLDQRRLLPEGSVPGSGSDVGRGGRVSRRPCRPGPRPELP